MLCICLHPGAWSPFIDCHFCVVSLNIATDSFLHHTHMHGCAISNVMFLGAHKSPSTAFCLLLRLFTLRCTEKQMTLMLNHVDSPYIRCIGFLYLRYAADPSTLWSWFEPYLHDEEPVQIRQGKADTTMGKYV